MRLSKRKINPTIEKQVYQIFYQALSDIHSSQETENFLKEILTKTELEAIAKRLAVAVYLEKGRSYENIKEMLKVSSATVATVAEQMKTGKGYQIALKKIQADEWADKWARKLNSMIGKNHN